MWISLTLRWILAGDCDLFSLRDLGLRLVPYPMQRCVFTWSSDFEYLLYAWKLSRCITYALSLPLNSLRSVSPNAYLTLTLGCLLDLFLSPKPDSCPLASVFPLCKCQHHSSWLLKPDIQDSSFFLKPASDSLVSLPDPASRMCIFAQASFLRL